MDTWKEFVERVGRRFGDASPEGLESRVATALTEIGTYLPEIDRKHIRLPDEAGRYFNRGGLREGDLNIDEIAEELGMPAGQGREFVESVVAAIDIGQVGEARQHWQRNLPAGLVQVLEAKADAMPRQASRPSGHTLADGMSGSRNPLASASPGHRDSPISDEEPHGDTKLSTSKGTTQERLGKTLADGRPGSSRPLSEED